jgi:hypothetical protein
MLIGHLNHCGFLIPQSHHFMGRICIAKHSTSKLHCMCPDYMCPDVQLDLALWLAFLASAGTGIAMNNLTFRHPTHVSWVNACEHGISGYHLVTGQAWHFEIPIHLQLWTLFNSLEHLASYIQLAFIQLTFEVETSGLPPSSIIPSSSPGWTAQRQQVLAYNSSFGDSTPGSPPLCLWVTHATAHLLLGHSSILFSKRFPGKENPGGQ